MGERHYMMGEHAELRQRRLLAAASCDALREKMRMLLPITEDAGKLDRDAILNVAASLHSGLGVLAEIDAKMAVLGRELGL